jgi:hypothetical protein
MSLNTVATVWSVVRPPELFSKDRYSSPRSRSFPGPGTLTVTRKSPVTAGLAEELVEDMIESGEAKEDPKVLVAVDRAILVALETIDRLLSMDSGLPKTTVVVV